MEVGSTWRHARDKFYKAPPLFSCNVEKIGEPGHEATLFMLENPNIRTKSEFLAALALASKTFYAIPRKESHAEVFR